MIPAKMDLGSRTIITLDEYPQSDVKTPFFKFGDTNLVENIAVMDYSEERQEIVLIFSSVKESQSAF